MIDIKTIITSILSSTVIVAMIDILRDKIDNKAKYISYERTRTDVSKKMRELIPKVYACNLRTQLMDLLPDIKSCINPYDFPDCIFNEKQNLLTADNIKHDVLLWDAIYQIENKSDVYNDDLKFNTLKTKIALYISCWLKHDWDRYHHEINSRDKEDFEINYIKAMISIYNTDSFSKDIGGKFNFQEIKKEKGMNLYLIFSIISGVFLLNFAVVNCCNCCEIIRYYNITIFIFNIILFILLLIGAIFQSVRNKFYLSFIYSFLIVYIIQFVNIYIHYKIILGK